MIPRHLHFAMGVMLVAALALSLYAWHVRKTVVGAPVASADATPLGPPVSGPMERVILFIAHDEDGTLRPESAQIPMPSDRQQRAEELLRTLVARYLEKNSTHTLGAGAEVRSVFLVEPGGAVIDVNSAFADTHRSGVLVEVLTVASLIHTVAANVPGISRVKILVDGKQRDTLAGHADLSSYYDVSGVNQLVAELQPQ